MSGYSGRTVIRYEASFTNLGNVPQVITLTGRAGLGPWAQGKILLVEAVKTAGPATQITFEIRETVPANVRLAFSSEPLPVKVQPANGPVPYKVADGTELELQASSDDLGATTDVDFVIEIEGPY